MAVAAPQPVPTIFKWDVSGTVKVEVRRTITGLVAYAYENGKKVDSRQADAEAVFERCVWKGTNGNFNSRLFRTNEPLQTKATLVSVDTAHKKIYTWAWNNFPDDDLKTKKPTIQVNADGVPSIVWENLDLARAVAFDLNADTDVVRERDYVTIGMDYAKKVYATRPGKVAAAALGYKSLELGARGLWWAGCGIASAASTVGVAGWEWVAQPVLSIAVDTFGYTGLAISGTVAVVQIADAYLPQYQIVPTIEQKFDAVRARIFG